MTTTRIVRSLAGSFGCSLGCVALATLLACTNSEPSRPTGAAGSGAGTNGGAGTQAAAGTNGGAGTQAAAGTNGGGAGTQAAAGTNGGAGTGTDAGAGGTTAPTDGGTTGPNQVPSTYTGRPLGGTPQVIPGKIQIENYDTGGEGVAFHDTGNGHGQLCGVTRTDLVNLNCTGQGGSPTDQTQGTCAKLTGDEYLGYIDPGFWFNYTVNVQQAGTYVISTHAGVAGTPMLTLTFTPTLKSPTLTLPGTSGCGVESYHVWAVQDNLGTIALQPGTYVMRLDFVAAGLNLDWIDLEKL
jgi:hypothetical protein